MTGESDGSTPGRPGEPFFTALSAGLLALVLVGFAPSLYLRPESAAPLRGMLVAHGVFLTAWYVLVVVQASLIAVGRGAPRIALHRGLGMASVVVVAGALVTSWVVSADLYRRGETDIMPPAALFFGNVFNLVGLVVCYSLGFLARSSDHGAHKRYMTLAGVVMIGPAAFRFLELFGVPGIYTIALQALIVSACFVYDRRTLGRVHRATWTGAGLMTLQIVGSFTIGSTAPWKAFVAFVAG